MINRSYMADNAKSSAVITDKAERPREKALICVQIV